MSPKEMLYLEDALGHEEFLIAQCQNAVQTLQDGELKLFAQQMQDKHNSLLKQLYHTL